MKKIILATNNFTRKMSINLSTAESMQDHVGEEFHPFAGAIIEDIDRETGEIKQCAAIVLDDGTTITSISPTVVQAMDDIIALMNDNETFGIRIVSRKSKANKRDYLSLTVF